MSKTPPRRPARGRRGSSGRASGAAEKARGGSRAALCAEPAPAVEEPAGAEAAFGPSFGDFSVPDEVLRAWRGQGDGRDGAEAPVSGEGAPCALGRVVRLDRGYPLVTTAAGSFRAEHAVALVKGEDVRATVGDWVALRLPDGHDKALIERILPRAGAITRWDGSGRGERQVLAANVDVLLVAQPLSKRAVPIDRVVRSVVLACEGGADAAVVLTKADRSPDPGRLADDVAQVRAAVGPGVPVVAASCLRGEGVEEVRALIPAGRCALLLGESGSGKSTLVNTLLGAEVLSVGAVRGRDDQGRHTTVARRMLKVPGAGVLVDAPGLRSMPLLDEDRGLALAFPEIEELVPRCRFRDCTHGSEPGCAVRAAVETGDVLPGRLEEYRLLAAEMLVNRRGLDPSAKASITQ